MLNDDFMALVRGECKNIVSLCEHKAAEYVGGDADRPGNSKRAVQLLKCTPDRAMAEFMAKYITPLYDFIAELEAGNVRSFNELARKTDDIALYCIMVKALIVEREQNTDD